MDRLIIPHDFDYSVSTMLEYGEKGSCPIDQSSAQQHNIDPMTGRPISDLTVVLRAQNKFEQEKMLADLQEFKAEYLPPEVSNDDAIKYAFPRLVQLPSELAEFQEKVAEMQYNEQVEKLEQERKAAYLEALRKEVEDSKKKVEDPKSE